MSVGDLAANGSFAAWQAHWADPENVPAPHPSPAEQADLFLGLNEVLVRDFGYENALGFGGDGHPVSVPVRNREKFLRDLRVARVWLRRAQVMTRFVPRFRARSGLQGGRPRRRSRTSSCSRAGPSDSDPHEPRPIPDRRGGR